MFERSIFEVENVKALLIISKGIPILTLYNTGFIGPLSKHWSQKQIHKPLMNSEEDSSIQGLFVVLFSSRTRHRINSIQTSPQKKTLMIRDKSKMNQIAVFFHSKTPWCSTKGRALKHSRVLFSNHQISINVGRWQHRARHSTPKHVSFHIVSRTENWSSL